MKKLFALAALFAVLGVSAQQKSEVLSQDKKEKREMRMGKKDGHRGDKQGKYKGERREKPSIEERVNKFDQYGVSSSQKKKIKALYEQRDSLKKKDFEKGSKDQIVKVDRKAQRESFNKEIEKILNKKQYAQYQENQAKKFEGKNKIHMKAKSGSKEESRITKSE